MSNNNMPEWAAYLFETTGISLSDWTFKFEAVPDRQSIEWIECRPIEWTRFEIEGPPWGNRVLIFDDSDDCEYCASIKTKDRVEAFKLADRLKRAIQQEPDPRVAELEALIQRFYTAGSAMVTGISIANDRQGANIKGGVVDNFNKVVNEAKSALAKARGGRS